MTVATLNAVQPPPQQAELVPVFFDPDLIVTPADNPVYTPTMLADLLQSVREHGQLVPGWVYPSPDLPPNMRLCLEGNGRLAVTRQLRKQFWAFDLGRPVPEAERIKLTFQHNRSRRAMSREEISEKAARYIELTGCAQGDAALHLNVSQATLSRAFGERRIPAELRLRADQLGLSIRSLIAAMPVALMAQAIEFAETPSADGKKPTRDQVSLFLRQLKKNGTGKPARPKVIALRLNGRVVTLTFGEKDSAYQVSEDFKAIIAKLGKLADVPVDGWPFLFQ